MADICPLRGRINLPTRRPDVTTPGGGRRVWPRRGVVSMFTMEVTGFAELTLQAHDVAVLERFYVDVVGLPVLARAEDRVWLGVGERARLGLWAPGKKEFGDEGGAHVHFALALDAEALDELARRLQSSDHDCRGPVEHDGGDRSLYWTDPEGNVGEAWELFREGGTVEDVED
jgi:catechol-2,3-dioxygenase